MVDMDSPKYTFIPNVKGIPPEVFTMTEDRAVVFSGSGKPLIIRSGHTYLSITDGLDLRRADEDLEIKKPRRLVAQLTKRNGEFGMICELTTKIPEEPYPHPDFFAVEFAAAARTRFEILNGASITFLEGDCEQSSRSYQLYAPAYAQGADIDEAFWATPAGIGSKAIGFSRLAALQPYQANGILAFSFRTELPTPTP